MNILITGGAGYIGSHICEKLINKQNKIILLDNLKTGHKKLIHKKAIFIRGNIKDTNLIKKLILRYKIKIIIHLAAYLNIKEAEKNKKKYNQNNVLGTKKLIQACKDTKIESFIFSSSCSVYGNVRGKVNENRKLKPHGYYAYTKLKSEELIKKYSKLYNFKFAILRYFNVAGASPSGKIGEIESSHGHLIKNFAIQCLKKNPKVNIYGTNYPTKDGTCVRDYIHVSDLADIHIKIINILKKKRKSIILNCGYGKGYSVKEISLIFRTFKKNLKINYQKRRLGDVSSVYSNNTKLIKTIKWKPKFNDINKIIKSSIMWEKKLSKILKI